MREARVALESAVLTHGLPYPLNLEVALALEEAVREEGATPKTIALVRGEVRVGLSREEMEALAAGGAEKASLWNLAALLAQGRSAGTTVAATVHLAHLHGIPVFATGGIGGSTPSPTTRAPTSSPSPAPPSWWSPLAPRPSWTSGPPWSAWRLWG